MTFIAAIFIGTDGSCGYMHERRYVLRVTFDVHAGYPITIERQDGTGYCPYQSLNAFLNNWSNVTKIT